MNPLLYSTSNAQKFRRAIKEVIREHLSKKYTVYTINIELGINIGHVLHKIHNSIII